MKIIWYKCFLKKKNNRKVILVIEDEYDWCFPIPIWEHIKDFVGIFDKCRYWLIRGWITKPIYNRFFKDEFSKINQKKFAAILKNEEEDFIEYYRVGIDDPSNSRCEFSSLWFFDINLDRGYLPAFLQGINTSSALAMTMCGMDRDDEEDDVVTLNDLLKFAPDVNKKSKEALKKILLMNYR